MKLHTIVIIIAMILASVVAGAQVWQYLDQTRLLARQSAQDLAALEAREQESALNVYNSIEHSIAGSLQRGEMLKFNKMLAEQRDIKGLLEFSLFDREGVVTHSSRAEAVKRALPDELKSKLLNSHERVSLTNDTTMEIYQPQPIASDCVRCHVTWKEGGVGGVTYFKFSRDAVAQAKTESIKTADTARARSLRNGVIIVIGTVLLLSVTIYVLVTRCIQKPIARIVARLGEGFTAITDLINKLSSSNNTLAEGACRQAAATEEIASSMETVTSTTRHNTESSTQASTLATQALASADNGTKAVSRMSVAMQEIKKASDETFKVVKTIEEIASQTNLLALNAAVEAARAGESGRGFAVVAEHVRSLAMRSSEAARNTATLIQESVKRAEAGVHIGEEVSHALADIAGQNRKVSDLLNEVAATSSEQTNGIRSVGNGIEEINKVSQDNASGASENASSSTELSEETRKLDAVVDELRAMVGAGAA